LIAGYLLAWAGFGIAAHLLDMAVHNVARQSDWLMLNGWVLGAVVLGGRRAIPVQPPQILLSRPLPHAVRVFTQHWRGTAPLRRALRLGLDTVSTVSAAGAIMLLMFIVGTGNVGWMLALARSWRWRRTRLGARLSRPLAPR